MVSSVVLASAAIALAAVEYYLGAGLYSLVFLTRAVRGTGREMMENATLSMVLVASWGLILSIVSFTASVLYPSGLNGAYESFYGWAAAKATAAWTSLLEIATLQWSLSLFGKTLLRIIPAFVFAPIPGMAVAEPAVRTYSSITAPWVGLLQTGYMVLQVSSTFGAILQSSWFVFVAYGSLAYALPKQLGRSIGGSLIAGAVVYYVGLPLMPAFVDYFTAQTAAGLELSPLSCATIQQHLPGYQCNPSLPFNVSGEQLFQLAYGVAPSINFQIWATLVLPLLYLGLLAAIVGGVTRLLRSMQLSLLPGGLL
jgi:hypothetical protein